MWFQYEHFELIVCSFSVYFQTVKIIANGSFLILSKVHLLMFFSCWRVLFSQIKFSLLKCNYKDKIHYVSFLFFEQIFSLTLERFRPITVKLKWVFDCFVGWLNEFKLLFVFAITYSVHFWIYEHSINGIGWIYPLEDPYTHFTVTNSTNAS